MAGRYKKATEGGFSIPLKWRHNTSLGILFDFHHFGWQIFKAKLEQTQRQLAINFTSIDFQIIAFIYTNITDFLAWCNITNVIWSLLNPLSCTLLYSFVLPGLLVRGGSYALMVNQKVCQCVLTQLSCNVPKCALLYYFTFM